MTFTRWRVPDLGRWGFKVVVGRTEGVKDLFLSSARLATGHVGPVHAHAGDEVIRVVEGLLVVRVGDQVRECGPADVVAVPAKALHEFRVLEEATLEVYARHDIGTYYPIHPEDDGEWVEVFRRDMPWGRQRPPGRDWTTDEEPALIVKRARQARPWTDG